MFSPGRLPGLALLLLLAGCAPREADLVTASPEALRGPAPDLLPTGDFALATAGGAGAAQIAADGGQLAARAEALRGRASGIDGPVVDPDTRPRLEAAEPETPVGGG